MYPQFKNAGKANLRELGEGSHLKMKINSILFLQLKMHLQALWTVRLVWQQRADHYSTLLQF